MFRQIKGYLLVPLLLITMIGVLQPVYASEQQPQVKKSKSGICHPIGGTYYKRTKKFTAYSTMAACLKSGGRKPKR